MTISEMQKECYDIAMEKGWGDKPIHVPEMVALIHSEASEALEEFRNHKPMSYSDEKGKPLGVASEMADILIRVAHYSELLHIDLEAEVRRKMDYNRTRAYRHGNKEC